LGVTDVNERRSLVIVFLVLLSALSFALTELPMEVSATTTHYVGGSGPGNYTSIQTAVDSATPGDTVYVYSGNYLERVVISKTLSLVGEDRDTTRIEHDMFTAVFVEADWVNITGFNVTVTGFDNVYGMRLYYVQNCRIEGNSAVGVDYGIYLWYSENNTIADNFLVDVRYGISLYASSNNTLTGNMMIGNGIAIGGDAVEHWNTHSIGTSNTVNGKPVHYMKDLTGGNAPANAGQVILANCDSMVVENLNVSNVSGGILLGFSHWNSISHNTGGISISWSNNNTVSNNEAIEGRDRISLYYSMDNRVDHNTYSVGGIYVSYSANNVIDNNTGIGARGVRLRESVGTTVTHNSFLNGVDGVVSLDSDYSLITYNSVLSSFNGIYLDRDSDRNIIHHNNIMDNEYQAYDEGMWNFWFDGYPSGGNYWSDCNCIDQFSGPSQDQPGSDGISDNPYNIDGGWNGDPYPLMSPIPARPSEPRYLQATAGDQQVTLTWTPPEFDGFYPIVGYRVYRGTTSGGETFLTEIGNVTTHVDTGLTNGQAYYYTISAMNLEKEGAMSDEASATPGSVPGAPIGLTATPGNQEVLLNWSPPIDDGGSPITSYNIHRGTTPGGETLLTAVGNVLNYVDIGLMNGLTYYYRISAVNDVGEGPYSNEANATPSAQPSNQPPICAISSPISGTTIAGTVTISGSASDLEGTVHKVEIRIDEGQWIQATGNASWTYEWETATVKDGEHTIHARSFDGTAYSSEVSVTVTVENAPPQELEEIWLWIAVGLIIVIVVVILLVSFLMAKKRKEKQREEPTHESSEEELKS
jgi:parallel beta-helix repeat protein